jgi:hypothetical protein
MPQAVPKTTASLEELAARDFASIAAWNTGTPNRLEQEAILSLDENDPRYALWQSARDDIQSLFHLRDGCLMLSIEEGLVPHAVKHIYIRDDFDRLWHDAVTSFWSGAQNFMTPAHGDAAERKTTRMLYCFVDEHASQDDESGDDVEMNETRKYLTFHRATNHLLIVNKLP